MRTQPTDDQWNEACSAIRDAAKALGYRVEADWLEHGALAAVAKKAGVSRAYVSFIWSGNRKATEEFLAKVVDMRNHVL